MRFFVFWVFFLQIVIFVIYLLLQEKQLTMLHVSMYCDILHFLRVLRN